VASSLAACATEESVDPGAESLEETPQEATQDLTLDRSYPPSVGGPVSYAKVVDRLKVTTDRITFELNGGRNNTNCVAKAWLQLPGQDEVYLGGNIRYIKDGGSVWFNDRNQTTETLVDVERSASCFKITMFADSLGHWGEQMNHVIDYCWNPTQKNWINQNTGTPIGSEESETDSPNGHLRVRYHWRVDWEATLVTGQLDVNPGYNQSDGPEWHHVPSIPWATNSTISASLAPVVGDPDLYAGNTFQPSTSNYSCASTSGWGQDDSCSVGSLGSAYFSVFNYRWDTNSAYDLVIDKAPGAWTPWLDRDDPEGGGDGEHLSEFVSAGQVCAKPLAAQCRRVSDKAYWVKTGENYTCSPSAGGVCNKAQQPDGTCDDYEVRFYCP
jgi:hypothetical protein